MASPELDAPIGQVIWAPAAPGAGWRLRNLQSAADLMPFYMSGSTSSPKRVMTLPYPVWTLGSCESICPIRICRDLKLSATHA